ncbi:pentapeptide repeat-containing protein [Falsihalocynthiibacter sp. S25ZX9]|uniref:pentapeptide repeat-containing protein n=1 Tax=Falsihalocynthiibacter sp. S25ZX9 TaxID=3240870 RepID=UPI00350F10F2
MVAITLEDASALRQVTGEIFRNDCLDDFSIFETEFYDCAFVDCTFDGGKIGLSKFQNCRFTDCSFRDVKLLSCQFYDADTEQRCVWSRCDLSDANLVDCDLSSNQLLACKGFMLRLENCILSAAEIDIDVHRRVNARFNMGGMSCSRTSFFKARMKGQDLQGSTFEICDLRGADLGGCNLSSANFAGSNLNNTLLRNASLTGANLAHADIDELDFSQARSLDDLTISADQSETLLNYFGVKVLSH